MMTQKQKLRAAFESGARLTSKQIRAQFKIASPTKVVSQLRLEDGFPVYANVGKDSRGNRVTRFKTGNPTHKVVAAGYRAVALGLA
jgi:hypothetical protein